MVRYLLLSILFLFSFSAQAADYIWYSEISSSIRGSDPLALCMSMSTKVVGGYMASASRFVCTGSDGYDAYYLSRTGDSCADGGTYDPLTGVCDSLPTFTVGSLCADQTGASPGKPMIYSIGGLCVNFMQADPTSTCMYLSSIGSGGHQRVAGTIDASGSGVAPKLAAVFGGECEGSVTSGDCVVGPTKCTKGLCTSPSTSSCVVEYSFTGRPAASVPPDNGLAAKDSICDLGADCNLPPPATTDENKPCSKVTDAEGRQSCTTSNFTGTDGAVNCGSVNGVFGCRGSYPSSKGIEIASTTAVQALIDGSTKEVTTNNATQSICNGGMGPGVCVISTSTSTVTTSHSSSGSVSGTATVCTGTLCGNAAVNTGTGSGTGTASGSVGDCVKDCGTPPGSSPKASSLAAPTQGNFDGEEDKWQKKIDDSKTEVVAALDKMKALFKPISNISLGGGGQLYCPPPVQILDHSISFCLDDYAGSLSWISEVVLLVCTVSAMFIIFL